MVLKSSLTIINEACLFYGSSLKGRLTAAKKMLQKNYRLPIIIEEENEIICFPLNNLKSENLSFIFFHNIINYQKEKDKIIVYFNSNNTIKLQISQQKFQNSINSSAYLFSLLKQRKNQLK